MPSLGWLWSLRAPSTVGRVEEQELWQCLRVLGLPQRAAAHLCPAREGGDSLGCRATYLSPHQNRGRLADKRTAALTPTRVLKKERNPSFSASDGDSDGSGPACGRRPGLKQEDDPHVHIMKRRYLHPLSGVQRAQACPLLPLFRVFSLGFCWGAWLLFVSPPSSGQRSPMGARELHTAG